MFYQRRAEGLTHTGLATVILQEHVGWDLEEGLRRQSRKDRLKREMFCSFPLGKGPWGSWSEMFIGTVTNSGQEGEALKAHLEELEWVVRERRSAVY